MLLLTSAAGCIMEFKASKLSSLRHNGRNCVCLGSLYVPTGTELALTDLFMTTMASTADAQNTGLPSTDISQTGMASMSDAARFLFS